MSPWFEHFAVAVCAISGVLAATGQRLDLFGVLVLALVTSVGGGTIRDLCLGVRPVFWVQDPSHIVTATLAALGTFVVARYWKMPHKALLIADAFGLALFTIVGVEKSLVYQSSGLIAIMLGVVTGVAGGMLRDVLRREVPMVFKPDIYFYATAAFAGAVVYVLLVRFAPAFTGGREISMAVILVLRLAAMGWKWRLPEFRVRG
ncbi:trimeric intracellular cation channel family protein [Verrucomicrobium spinosum]|uniref:trimeric intracellular cation channel family protein n=1 Tax=Verrucomicrobium spinosum TaxID=2736 RepID=UPI00017445FF|nr:trimeric intracellular cation channel family protein [Verrucomicrobium spinosum]